MDAHFYCHTLAILFLLYASIYITAEKKVVEPTQCNSNKVK